MDSSGNAYIAGQTQSPNFPVRSAYQTIKAGSGDAFVVKLSAAGAFIFSTHLGGKGMDSAKAIALDAQSNIYLTGSTYSIDFPTSTGAFQRTKSGQYDAFVTKMNSAGTALVWSTYLGGAESDEGNGDCGGRVRDSLRRRILGVPQFPGEQRAPGRIRRTSRRVCGRADQHRERTTVLDLPGRQRG